MPRSLSILRAGVGVLALTAATAALGEDIPMPPDDASAPAASNVIDTTPTGSIPDAIPTPAPSPPALAPRIVHEPVEGPDERASGQPTFLPPVVVQAPDAPEDRLTSARLLQGAPDVADAIRAALVAFAAKPAPDVAAALWPRARDGVSAVYRDRNFAPLWLSMDGFGPSALKALARLRLAADDGVDLRHNFLPADHWRPKDVTEMSAADVALSGAIVAYAEQASGGRIDPRRLSPIFDLKPEVADAAQALAQVAAADDAGARLQSFNPPQPEYARLRDILARLRAAAKDSPDALKTVASGTRLAMNVPTAALPAPRAEVDPNKEIDAVLANMEMWRWQPRDLGATHVAVNIADFSLRLVRDGETALSERVIVGKPNTPTNVFSDNIRLIVLNPAWHVPDSIINKEFLPKLAKDPDYLARHGFQTKMVGDKLVVVQPPGEENALGRILFMFPNDHAIYLHDTSSRALFKRDYRALSHGCVRLDQPFQFGAALLADDPAYANYPLERAIGGGERTLRLGRQTPIHMQYFTRFVDDSGLLQRRADLYGLERLVADTLFRLRQS